MQEEACKENLVSDDVCLIDTGKLIYVWIGSGSSKREQSQAMMMAEKHMTTMGNSNGTMTERREDR